VSAAGDNLRRVRARIDTPEKWCRSAMAQRMVDEGVDEEINLVAEDCLPEDHGACRFCLLGALAVVGCDFALDDADAFDDGGNAYPLTEQRLLEAALPPRMRTAGRGLDVFNDSPRTAHADMLALVDRAIVAADAEAA
jgi:hypothetical protein